MLEQHDCFPISYGSAFNHIERDRKVQFENFNILPFAGIAAASGFAVSHVGVTIGICSHRSERSSS